jgi:hypothetical protein
MRRWLLLLSLALAGIVVVAGASLFLVWDLDWRWQPHTLTKNQDSIAKMLDQAGWVSPHLTGPKLYVIAYRACPDCLAFETAEFPKLQQADVDTRVIVVARPDLNGQALSTSAERATVAELWLNRSWKLFQQWSLAAPDTWTAPSVAPADGDGARTAVIEAGRQMVSDLTPELADSGVPFAYPTLVWWTRDGRMRACACGAPQTWKYVQAELAAPVPAPTAP